MLKRSFIALLSFSVLAFGAASAQAAGTVQCPPGTSLTRGYCVITAIGGGGGGATPISNPGGGSGSGDSGPASCSSGGTTIPCTTEHGAWNGRCYVKVSDPQPPATDPLWAGRDGGVILTCTVPATGGIFDTPGLVINYWSATRPDGGPTPRQVADLAIADMAFQAGEIGITPPPGPDAVSIVGLPTWMWVANPGEITTGPIARSATAGGITVTATGTLDRIVWDMGDGTSVTCRGNHAPGTPYDARYGDQSSPTCGHRYTRASGAQPGGTYTVTATSYWTIAWAGGGQTGTVDLDFSRSIDNRVGELQVLVR